MNKKYIMVGIGTLILIAFSLILINNQKSSDESELMEEPVGDEMRIDVSSEDALKMAEMTFQYEGELLDVTKGKVRGINTNGQASGIAKSNFEENEYNMMATFENLLEPTNDDFYEGWLVQKETSLFISTGKIEKVNGAYVNSYKSGDDLTNTYNFYVLTLEPNDGDLAPADHIVEGLMLAK